MPLNSIPPTTTVDNLKTKIDAANGNCWVDVGFYGGVIPGNHNDLVPLIKAGVKGFKCFLIESGVEEFPYVKENDVRKALETLQSQNTVLMFHAEMEDDDPHTDTTDIQIHASNQYKSFLNSRPQSLELNAITLISRLAKEYTTVPVHIVHLSASDALPIVRKAKEVGASLTVETCFHYLSLSAEEILPGRTEFKCCPPIRNDENRGKLWEALKDGTIDYVVSDHSPCTEDLKSSHDGNFVKAWGGISSLQFGLPVLWTEARKRGCSLGDLHKWLSRNTAKRVGLQNRKGDIKVGYDADLVIWNPEESFLVSKDNIQFKNKLTPYEGRTLYGVVKKTFLRGKIVYDIENGGIQGKPIGQLLL